MLRRANTKSSNRLSRRKSTSSIYTKQDHIDPETARLHAQAAAAYAFTRAYERHKAEIGSSVKISNKNQTLSHRGLPDQHDESRPIGRGLRRKQSVRFTGSEAGPRNQITGTKVSQDILPDKPIKASLRPIALTNNVPVPAEYRPPSRSSSIGKASIGKVTAQEMVTALAAYDEYYAREDDVASTPSSYRRLRKSKSTRTLCSPLKATSASLKDVLASDDCNARTWNRMPRIQSQQLETTLRAPKSMSFLKGQRGHMTRAVRENNDNAVQMARDNFLYQIEQQRLRAQPSFLFRAKERREEIPFRQSVRSGSANSYGLAVGSANQTTKAKESSLRLKVRNASRTIRKRLRELFKLDIGQHKEATIPVQQVGARVSHKSTNYLSTQEVRHDETFDIPRPESATVLRVSSRLPSIYSVPSSQQLRSRNGSVRSQRSDASGKSRVTSWTNTADNTATSRQTQAEKEAQRLSIIQENGTHVPKTSTVPSRLSSQLSAYPLFYRPSSAQRRGGQRTGTVDSQKVYSALMKRLDENSPVAKLEARRLISGEEFGVVDGIPPRSSSVSSRHSSRVARTPATIRYVQDDKMGWINQKEMHNKTLTSLPLVDDDVFSPKHHLATSTIVQSQDAQNSLGVSEACQIPPQQRAARNELLAKAPIILRETRSTFFGNSSLTMNRSTSPYRRALATADRLPSAINGGMLPEPSPNRILFLPPIIHCSEPKELVGAEPVSSDGPYTESVYSRTTSGQVPAAESSHSLPSLKDESRLNDSDSVIVSNPRTYQPTGPTRSRTLSHGSSEGRGSLTPEASRVEKSKERICIASIHHALSSLPKYSGHYREHAQITPEDTDISLSRAGMERQPIGILQKQMSQSLQPMPMLKHKVSICLDRFPLPPPPPPPLPPTVPIRSPLHTMQSRASLRSINNPSKHQIPSAPCSTIKLEHSGNHQLLRPNSITNINQVDTPVKLVTRSGQSSHDFDLSPGIEAAVKKQFGSIGSRTPYSGMENYSPLNLVRSEQYGSTFTGHKEMKDTEAQVMGSRVMVDMFLSSRRRKVAGSDESNAFL